MSYTQHIFNELAMLDFAGKLAIACEQAMLTHAASPCLIYLSGELGAGKTTLVRGFLPGLGHLTAVKSPTYTLVEPYKIGDLEVFHFDLYRIKDPEELEFIGIHDYFKPKAICLVEWPENGKGVIPAEPDLYVQINTITDQPEARNLTLLPKSSLGKEITNRLMPSQ